MRPTTAALAATVVLSALSASGRPAGRATPRAPRRVFRTRTPLAVLVAMTVVATLFAAPARADVTQPTGRLCSFFAVTHDDGATYEVTFNAGPLNVVDEDDPSVVRTATVTCSLNQPWDGDHTATPYAAVTSGPSTGAAVLPPTTVTVPGPFPEVYQKCTRVTVDGSPLYWHEPHDRNVAGWWSTSPTATCDDGIETLDSRPEDPPIGWVWSAAAMTLGEADAVVPFAEATLCALPEDVREGFWTCGVPSAWTTISLARVSEGGAVVRSLPFGWSCSDVHTGLPLAHGSSLATPDPGVSCVPPAGWAVECGWLQVSGVLAPTTLGRVALTNSCGTLSVTRPFVPVQGRLVELWSGVYGGDGVPPWRCLSDEDTTGPVAPVWTLTCSLLGW